LILRQVIEKQLNIGIEVRIRSSRIREVTRRQETVHLHGAVVAEVEVELVSGDGDFGDGGGAGGGDGPDAAVAGEPGVGVSVYHLLIFFFFVGIEVGEEGKTHQIMSS
jgi:hypothetical protein